MVALMVNELSGVTKHLQSILDDRIRLGFKGYIQLFFYSFLFIYPSYSYAGPDGGNIVGGAGSISQSDLTTTINQSTSSLAINWDSYNVNANEMVNYIQPDASSIALNNILGNNASEIHGQINANGQVVLVNPNGIFFGVTSSVNVGGLIASGLAIDPVNFMNGDYIFNEVLGTDGTVINTGLINAALGGNIALLGKQVVNEGVISAQLGSVNLAAGKAAVLTFDQQGLLGVRVTEAILQDELGIDPAVLNSGEINAEGGRVLLTASISQDVFSQAVNSDGIEQAISAVVHEDGSFTLGGGADVVNTGSVDVSSASNNQDAGQVIFLGENITSSGAVRADSATGKAGAIELHANDKLILEQRSLTSATSGSENGGRIKVLGDKVGLFGDSVVDASGQLNGGEVLIGGDFQGKNQLIRNASITYVSENVSIKANSEQSGDGGKVIVWADKTTRYYGNIQAKGGEVSGDGGFAEVSGKDYLGFAGTVNLSANYGTTGTLLLDPRDITIENGGADVVAANDAFSENTGSDVTFDADLITDILQGVGVSAANVELQANRDIFVNETITVSDGSSTTSLTLRAGDDIRINNDITLTGGALSIISGDSGGSGGGGAHDISLGANLSTSGGDITLNGDSLELVGTSANRQISTGSSTVGNIEITGIVVNPEQTNHNSLTLAAGSGNITFNSDIGSSDTDNLGKLQIDSATTVNLNGVRAGTSGIDITATTINLSGSLRSSDDGAGNILLKGDVVLLNNIQSLTGGGNFSISGSLNADAAANNNGILLGIGGGNVDIQGAIGDTQRLGVFRINSANNVTLGTTSVSGGLNADSVNIIQSNSIDTSGFAINTVQPNTVGGDVTLNADTTISTGSITTSGGAAALNTNGLNGGNIDLAAEDITVGALTTTGSDASGTATVGGDGGNLILIADNNSGTKSVTLNGDVNTSGGNGITPGVAGATTVNLNGSGAGSFTTNHVGVLTTGLTVTSNTGSTDTINAADFDNTWIVTADNEGTLNGNISFVSFENLNGGSLNDIFTLNSGVTLSGAINGGGGINTLTRTDGTNDWILTAENAGTLTGTGGFANIQILNGGINLDTFTALDQANSWDISGNNSGSVENTNTPTDTVTFTGMENLNGNSFVDTVVFQSTGDVTGLIDTAGGDDLVDLTLLAAAVTVELQDAANINLHIVNAETINANTGLINTLIGADVANNWDINAQNAGVLNSVVNFSGFTNLTGGTADDIFVISGANGQLTGGVIDGGGGAGTDSITGRNTVNIWNLNTTDGGILSYDATSTTLSNIENFTGGTDTDNFTLSGIGSTISGAISGNGGNDTLTVSVAGNHNWEVTGVDSGTVNDIGGGFFDIDNLVGNSGVDTFTLNGGTLSGNMNGLAGLDIINADTGDNNWLITGVNSGVVEGVGSFTDIENLNGNSGADNFTLSGGTVSGAIDGGTGSNSLQADNVANFWNITGSDVGTVTGVGAGFSNIQTLTGGSLVDSFVIAAGGSVSGLVSGNLGVDSLNISALLADTTVQIGNTVNGNLNILGFESLTANNALANTLLSDNSVNSWQITGVNIGTLNGMAFTGFKRLVGNAQVDTFAFQDGWSVENGIDALGGIDIADGSALTGAVVFQLGAIGLDNFETFIGNNIDSTLIGDDIANTWDITGNNSGTVGAITFTDFNHLTGGDLVDIFNISGSGLLSGVASGGAGNDVANLTLTGVENGSFTFDGGADLDSMTLTGGNSSYLGQYDSDVAGFEQFDYTLDANNYTVNYTQTEIINDDLMAASLTVNGTSVADTINLESNQFIVNLATSVNYTQKAELIVNGQAGNDTINIVGDVNQSGGDLSLTAETIDNSFASTISADTLTLENVNAVINTINTNITQLNLNNVVGDVFIDELNGISIGQMDNLGGSLFVTNQTGDILDSAPLVSVADLHLEAQSGNILFDNANQLSGELSLVAVNGSITFNNLLDTQLATITALDLNITSSGSIIESTLLSSLITVTNSTTLSAAGQDIILDGPGHSFNNLTVSNTNNLILADAASSGLTLNSINVTGDASLTAQGDLNMLQVSAGGTVGLITSGAVSDGNGTANNVTAVVLAINAVSGIGNSDQIETQVSIMDIINSGSGDIRLDQNGSVEFVALQNAFSNGTISIVSNGDFNFNPGSVVANRATGTLFMSTVGGSFLGVGGFDLSNPDITANTATFIGLSGTFGTPTRPIILDVPKTGSVLIDTQATSFIFTPETPDDLITTGVDIGILGSISAIAGEQLIEIESLGEIDPAIFTALRSYSQEDIAIRMPRDQLFEDELEEGG